MKTKEQAAGEGTESECRDCERSLQAGEERGERKGRAADERSLRQDTMVAVKRNDRTILGGFCAGFADVLQHAGKRANDVQTHRPGGVRETVLHSPNPPHTSRCHAAWGASISGRHSARSTGPAAPTGGDLGP